MVDCPEKLHSGADLLISLSVYLLPSAFRRYTPDLSSSTRLNLKTFFDEGQETTEEEALRERKYSLQQMFDKLSLRPRAEEIRGPGKENIPPEGQDDSKNTPTQLQSSRNVLLTPRTMNLVNQRKLKMQKKYYQKPTSISYINGNTFQCRPDSVTILKRFRAQAHDAQMDEMDPCEAFTLKLRPYQKQAL